MDDDSNLGFQLQQGRLYLHLTRGKRLLRFIAQDAAGETLLFKLVNLQWNPTPTEVLVWRRDFSIELKDRGRLQEYEEQVRPEFMGWPDERLVMEFQSSRKGVDIDRNRAWLEQCKVEYASIKPLLSPEVLFSTYSPETQMAVIRAHLRGTTGRQERDPVAEQAIVRLLHRCGWFGFGRNSLLKLTHMRGHMDVLVRTSGKKTGAPNALVKLGIIGGDATRDDFARYAGRNVTEKDIRIFVDALQRWYVKLNYSYRETYDLMVEFLYVQKTRNEAGEEVVWPIGRLKVPTFFAFEKHARRLVRELKLDVEKAGPLDGKELEPRRGYDADIAPRFGDVFCLDATGFNKEAILEVKLDGETKNVGKNTVVIVRDRGSGDPRGWHVYTGFESWDEGYRLALLCAITSKKRHLAYLKIDDPDAWDEDEDIAPLAVSVDNGPAVGKDAEDAFDRFAIRTLPNAPGMPNQKGGEESLIGRVQKAQANTPGAYTRNNTAREREVRRKAKQHASENTYEIERQLVLSLIEERRKRNKQNLFTIDMKKSEKHYAPCSRDIVRYWIDTMGGVKMRLYSEADVYLNLLKHKRSAVTVDGVRFNGSRYNSDRLKALRLSVAGKLAVRCLYHPSRPEEAYWIAPTGELDLLAREKLGAKLHGYLTTSEIQMVNFRDRASGILEEDKRARFKSKKKGQVTVEQHQILLDIVSRGAPRKRTVATKDIDDARALALALQKEQRPYDKPEHHVPHLAKKRAELEGRKLREGVGEASPSQQPAMGSESSPAAPPAPSTAAAPPPASTAPSGAAAGSSMRRVSSAELWRQRQEAKKRESDSGEPGC